MMMDEDGKVYYDEFVQCVKSSNNRYLIYSIAAGIATGLLTNAKDSMKQKIIRKSLYGFGAYTLVSLVINYTSIKSCKPKLELFFKAVEEQGKLKHEQRLVTDTNSAQSTASENVSHTLNLNFDLPINFSDDINVAANPKNFYDEGSSTVSKKPVTYDDLWKSHIQEVKSRKSEEYANIGMPVETPKPRPVTTNIYGDRLD